MASYNSLNFNGRIFLNTIPTVVTKQGAFLKILRENFFDKNKHLREPKQPLGPFKADLKVLNSLPKETLRVTWLGHSTVLFEIDGKLVLTDPVWAARASPFSFLGPKRFFEVPINLEELPPLDGIIISHNHYDHLDSKTVKILGEKGNRFFCPLGVGIWLQKYGIAKKNITEFDWWDEINFDGFSIIATPARHFSGRWLTDRFKTLWASWIIAGPRHNVFFGADSGMFPGFKEIGDKYGPFDLTALEIGAANDDWEDIHMGPIKAVEAQLMLNGRLLLPIHWATFNLSTHPWQEPIESLIPYAEEKGIKLLIPEPGETIKANQDYNSNWWSKWL